MALESGTKISNLVQDNPPGTDQVAQGDDHIRLIKGVLKASFPSDVAVQIPDIAGHKGDALIVSEDETSIEWGTSAVATLKVDHVAWGHTNGYRYSSPTLVKSVMFTPLSETSTIRLEVVGSVSAWGDGRRQDTYVMLKDITNDVDLTPTIRVTGFNHVDDAANFEIYGTVSILCKYDTHPITEFEVGLYSWSSDAIDGGANMENLYAIITETE